MSPHVKSFEFDKFTGRKNFDTVQTRRTSNEKMIMSEGNLSGLDMTSSDQNVNSGKKITERKFRKLSFKSLNDSSSTMTKSIDFSKMQARTNIFVKPPAT